MSNQQLIKWIAFLSIHLLICTAFVLLVIKNILEPNARSAISSLLIIFFIYFIGVCTVLIMQFNKYKTSKE